MEIDHSFWSLSLCSQGDFLRFPEKRLKKVLEAKILPLPAYKWVLRATKWSIVTTWVILSKIGANQRFCLVSLFHSLLISGMYSLVCSNIGKLYSWLFEMYSSSILIGNLTQFVTENKFLIRKLLHFQESLSFFANFEWTLR